MLELLRVGTGKREMLSCWCGREGVAEHCNRVSRNENVKKEIKTSISCIRLPPGNREASKRSPFELVSHR